MNIIYKIPEGTEAFCFREYIDTEWLKIVTTKDSDFSTDDIEVLFGYYIDGTITNNQTCNDGQVVFSRKVITDGVEVKWLIKVDYRGNVIYSGLV